MKGYIINPDREYTNKIIEGIYRKNGHCPCRLEVNETTLCPCDQFINEKICKCNLYVPEEEKSSTEK